MGVAVGDGFGTGFVAVGNARIAAVVAVGETVWVGVLSVSVSVAVTPGVVVGVAGTCSAPAGRIRTRPRNIHSRAAFTQSMTMRPLGIASCVDGGISSALMGALS